MKKLIAVLLGAVLLLDTTACAARERAPQTNVAPPPPVAQVNTNVVEFQHKLANGRTITCLGWARSAVNGGGLSCDWANAK